MFKKFVNFLFSVTFFTIWVIGQLLLLYLAGAIVYKMLRFLGFM